MAEANGEIANASQVDIYGLKKEGSTPILWIHDSVDINVFGTAGGYTALLNSSQYPSDFRKYKPSDYRVERTTPLKLSISPSMIRVVADATSEARLLAVGVEAEGQGEKVKCSYPLDDSQLRQGHFPHLDWQGLIQSLWAPWCGYWFTGAMVIVEADGPDHTFVATADPGVLYMRGYPQPTSHTSSYP